MRPQGGWDLAIYNGEVPATVVQWIERPPPKGQIQVRFLSGAPVLPVSRHLIGAALVTVGGPMSWKGPKGLRVTSSSLIAGCPLQER